MKRLLVALLLSLVLLSACTASQPKPFPPPEGYSSWKEYQEDFDRKATTPPVQVIPTPTPTSTPTPTPTPTLTPTPTPPPVSIAPARFVLAEPTIAPAVVKTGDLVTISIAVSNTG